MGTLDPQPVCLEDKLASGQVRNFVHVGKVGSASFLIITTTAFAFPVRLAHSVTLRLQPLHTIAVTRAVGRRLLGSSG